MSAADPVLRRRVKSLTRGFYSQLKRLHAPDPLTFVREAVVPHQPCVLTGLLDDGEGSSLTLAALKDLLEPDAPLVVNFTPDGRADSLVPGKDVFQLPLEEQVSASHFFDMLHNPVPGDVPGYLSEQNNNLTSRYPSIEKLVDRRALNLGLAAFGPPEASNLWIGSSNSVTSLHKDHYENLYLCLDGEKMFTLLPPTDILQVTTRRNLAVHRWERIAEATSSSKRPQLHELTLRPTGDAPIEWIDDDWELSNMTSPLNIRLQAGEVLYIPSFWLHSVTQSRPTLAVNYWFDCNFANNYVLSSLCKTLASGHEQDDDLCADNDDDDNE